MVEKKIRKSKLPSVDTPPGVLCRLCPDFNPGTINLPRMSVYVCMFESDPCAMSQKCISLKGDFFQVGLEMRESEISFK